MIVGGLVIPFVLPSFPFKKTFILLHFKFNTPVSLYLYRQRRIKFPLGEGVRCCGTVDHRQRGVKEPNYGWRFQGLGGSFCRKVDGVRMWSRSKDYTPDFVVIWFSYSS